VKAIVSQALFFERKAQPQDESSVGA
jgi:hypothetical protein